MTRSRYDVVVVGGGHNGLTAAAYLARAGRSVLVLERADHLGGATGSARVFPGVDARLSRYSYLVSLLPRAIRDELGLSLELRRRRVASYTPVPGRPERGLLVDTADSAATGRAFAAIGAASDHAAWRAFGERTQALARAVFPGVTRRLPSADEARTAVGEQWWADLHAPLGWGVATGHDRVLLCGGGCPQGWRGQRHPGPLSGDGSAGDGLRIPWALDRTPVRHGWARGIAPDSGDPSPSPNRWLPSVQILPPRRRRPRLPAGAAGRVLPRRPIRR